MNVTDSIIPLAVERISEQRVLAICIPSAGGPRLKFHNSLMAMLSTIHAMGRRFDIGSVIPLSQVGPCLPSVRHDLVLAAVENHATDILWLDNDMVFPPDTAFKLLAHKLPIVGANYYKKQIPSCPVSCGFDSNYVSSRGKIGLEKVGYTGLGCMLVSMEVFINVARPWFETRYVGDYDSYDIDDACFYKAVRKAGYEIWIDHDLSQNVAHVGEYEYTWRDEAPT